ncbi:MAG: abortive phage resistance protein, partial [Desulfovibrio sp.]|nr:abortive phage resistance protein [Desulfovibrio sp.]
MLDPYKQITVNPALAPKVEEIRSLILDAYIPNIKFVFCNNGLKWNSISQKWIDELKDLYREKISFDHFNHTSIINILRSTKKLI